MLNLLLIIWVATFGADRIDLSGGLGGFVLTPFLILSPLVIALGYGKHLFFRDPPAFDFKLPAKNGMFFLSVYFLLYLIFISVIFGADFEIGFKRFILLLMELSFTFLIINLIRHNRDAEKIFIRGAYAGLALYAVFCAAELTSWLAGDYLDFSKPAQYFINTLCHSIGHAAPRLSGMSMDPNRGGLILMFYAFCVIKFQFPSLLRNAFLAVATFFLVLTLSKTAIISVLALLVALFYQQRSYLSIFRIQNLGKVIFGLLMLLAVQSVFFGDLEIWSKINFNTLVTERFSTSEETSGGIHLELIQRGFGTAISDVKNALIGNGFGASYTLLDDLFPDNKYANFHSIYVSFLAETGLPSLFLILLICFYPLLISSPYVPLVLGVGVFNLFYQLTFEPLFWIALLMSWYNFSFQVPRSMATEPVPVDGPVRRGYDGGSLAGS